MEVDDDDELRALLGGQLRQDIEGTDVKRLGTFTDVVGSTRVKVAWDDGKVQWLPASDAYSKYRLCAAGGSLPSNGRQGCGTKKTKRKVQLSVSVCLSASLLALHHLTPLTLAPNDCPTGEIGKDVGGFLLRMALRASVLVVRNVCGGVVEADRLAHAVDVLGDAMVSPVLRVSTRSEEGLGIVCRRLRCMMLRTLPFNGRYDDMCNLWPMVERAARRVQDQPEHILHKIIKMKPVVDPMHFKGVGNKYASAPPVRHPLWCMARCPLLLMVRYCLTS